MCARRRMTGEKENDRGVAFYRGCVMIRAVNGVNGKEAVDCGHASRKVHSNFGITAPRIESRAWNHCDVDILPIL